MENLHIGDEIILTAYHPYLKMCELGTSFKIKDFITGGFVLLTREDGKFFITPKETISDYFKFKEDTEEHFLLSMTPSDVAFVDSVMFKKDMDIIKIPTSKENIISYTIREDKDTGVIVFKMPNEVIDLIVNENEDVLASITVADINQWYETAKTINKNKKAGHNCNTCSNCTYEK